MTLFYFDEQGRSSQYRQGLLTPPPDDQNVTPATTPDADDTEHDDRSLEDAVTTGNLHELSRIFDSERRQGHPVERLGAKRLSGLLLQALDQRDARIVSYLINQDVPFGTGHVEWAITRGLTSFLGVFLQRGWDINEFDRRGLPLLVKVLEHIDLVAWFLKHGANPNVQSHRGVTPLSMAVAHYSLEHVRILISHGGRLDKGQLLHFAVCRQDAEGIEIANFLLESGAEVNTIMCEDDRATFEAHKKEGLGAPLHYAASTGTLDMVKLLLRHGADPMIRNTLGKSSLDVARDAGHNSVIEAMQASGVRVHKTTNHILTQRQQISISDLCN